MFQIIAKRFTPDEFDIYVKGIENLPTFHPTFCVVHNTSVPDLSQRPNGFTHQHMLNLQDYYANKNGWPGGPHLFIDDTDNGIWVFNPLDRHGTHSPSWNATSYGIEMLGEYESDAFTSGRGAKVRDNAVRAVAALLRKIGTPATNLTVRFHKEDANTTHKTCPGKHVVKADFLALVADAMGTDHAAPVPIPTPVKPAKPADKAVSVTLKGESSEIKGFVRDGNSWLSARALTTACHCSLSTVTTEPFVLRIGLPDGQTAKTFPAMNLNGVGYVDASDVCKFMGLALVLESGVLKVG